MKCCYTVNACREVDIHVCHVNTVVFVNDLNTWIFEFFTNDSIQFLDDNNKVWNNFFKVVKRPFFKGFSQDSVVCVIVKVRTTFDSFVNQKLSSI